MENSLYGPYDISNDKEVPLRKATDNQYNNDVRLGAMLNLSFLPADSRHSFDWKNIFNIIAKERYSERVGINTQPDNINNMEYLYSSRTTYTLNSPESTISITIISTGAGYAYANRDHFGMSPTEYRRALRSTIPQENTNRFWKWKMYHLKKSLLKNIIFT